MVDPPAVASLFVTLRLSRRSIHAATADGQQHGPKAQKAGHAGEDNQWPAGIVVERPRADGMGDTPDHDSDHDPADDLFGTGGRGGWHAERIRTPSDFHTPAQRRGLLPRFGENDRLKPVILSRPYRTDQKKAPGTVQFPGGRGN
jgi:hypothetical protein